jgi:hypothetical protein
MIRRILVIGGIGLATAGGARFVLGELTERRWEARKRELVALAEPAPAARRPWELRFEALHERVSQSTKLEELARSSHWPAPALGADGPRALDELERAWFSVVWGELVGLEGVLAELARLPSDALEWHGAPTSLATLRWASDALCTRAWLALEEGDSESAAHIYASALALARATDDGTTEALANRCALEEDVLRALRASLAFGARPGALLAAVGPELALEQPELAARRLRRDLTQLAREDTHSPSEALAFYRGVEEALERADEPWSEAELAAPASKPWSLARRLAAARASKHHVALTALSVAAFRAEHGRFPEALEELAEHDGEHVLDPLTGQPLAYALDDRAARIGPAAWSRAEGGDAEELLFTWTVRAPAERVW